MRQMICKMYDKYKEQDYENGYFDVIFDVQGKELYAHRAVLASVSTVFKKLFDQHHSTSNQSIQIDGFTYDEFYEFLRYIYWPNYLIDLDDSDEEYIYAFIELSNIYEIDEFKDKCADVLKNILPDYDAKDAFKIFEVAYKYLFANYEANEYIRGNFDDLIGYDGFINLDKSVIQAFVYYSKNIEQAEELCNAVYKWGEHQAMITVEMSDEEKKKLVLHQIKDILPFFTLTTLLEFFVKRKGLLSVNEAKKIKTIEVKIKSGENTISCSIIDYYDIFHIINFFKNKKVYYYCDKERVFGWKKFVIPSTPSSIQKRENIGWYLLFDGDQYLTLKHRSQIRKNDYLIAEMKASNGNDDEFMFGINDDVYATVSRKYEQIF